MLDKVGLIQQRMYGERIDDNKDGENYNNNDNNNIIWESFYHSHRGEHRF